MLKSLKQEQKKQANERLKWMYIRTQLTCDKSLLHVMRKVVFPLALAHFTHLRNAQLAKSRCPGRRKLTALWLLIADWSMPSFRWFRHAHICIQVITVLHCGESDVFLRPEIFKNLHWFLRSGEIHSRDYKKMSNAVSDKQLNARAQFMERNKACTC